MLRSSTKFTPLLLLLLFTCLFAFLLPQPHTLVLAKRAPPRPLIQVIHKIIRVHAETNPLPTSDPAPILPSDSSAAEMEREVTKQLEKDEGDRVIHALPRRTGERESRNPEDPERRTEAANEPKSTERRETSRSRTSSESESEPESSERKVRAPISDERQSEEINSERTEHSSESSTSSESKKTPKTTEKSDSSERLADEKREDAAKKDEQEEKQDSKTVKGGGDSNEPQQSESIPIAPSPSLIHEINKVIPTHAPDSSSSHSTTREEPSTAKHEDEPSTSTAHTQDSRSPEESTTRSESELESTTTKSTNKDEPSTEKTEHEPSRSKEPSSEKPEHETSDTKSPTSSESDSSTSASSPVDKSMTETKHEVQKSSGGGPNIIRTIIFLLILGVLIERTYFLYKKYFAHNGQDTSGFSRIESHEDQFDHEEFLDERVNERL